MDSTQIVSLYKAGYSIDYIINKFYLIQKRQNKVLTSRTHKIIFIENPLTKNEVRGQVYKIIYSNIKKL